MNIFYVILALTWFIPRLKSSIVRGRAELIGTDKNMRLNYLK